MAVRVAARAVEPKHLVVGVSGGADSMALAAALIAEGYHVHAVAVDHQLQPGSAEAAAHAVEQLRSFGATGEVIAVHVAPGNLEAQAREARYAALHSLGLPVAVAHTAEDQAETLLLSALRGRAVGMAVAGEVWRPLLNIRRSQTRGACEELGITVWDDPHNLDPRFARVGMRTQVIPLLAELTGGDPIPALARAAELIAQDEQALHTPAENDCSVLAAMPDAYRRRAIAAWLHTQGVPLSGRALSGVDALVVDWHGQGGVAVGGMLEVVRKSGKLSVCKRKGGNE
ncbi:tRNA lysidine(34) synthetase TilS [Corynebacterium sp. 35RC1]|nr:tRNA lysidine(34) synthetase TilS [Corynebacterium sp. 35RC1]